MNRELEGTGIKVLYLAPRATNTELNSEAVKQLNQALGNHSDEPEVVAQHVLTTLEREHNMRWIGWRASVCAHQPDLAVFGLGRDSQAAIGDSFIS